MFIILLSGVFFVPSIAFADAIADILSNRRENSNAHYDRESYLAGYLIQLTKKGIITTAGNYNIESAVVVDNRKQSEHSGFSQVLLKFKNKKLFYVSIY
jgi:hypothetical protein